MSTLLFNASASSNNLPPHNWIAPQKTVHFICDLHADADALLASLKLGGLLAAESTLENPLLTEKASDASVIIGGDCFDKGPSNLALFRLLKRLVESNLDLQILAGNHDLRVYAGLLATDFQDDLRQAHFFVRMGRKAASLFAEVYQQYCAEMPLPKTPSSWIENSLMPDEEWFELFPKYACNFMTAKQIKKELKQIRKKRIDFIKAWREYGYDWQHLALAVEKAKQLFIEPDGEFYWFFQNLELMQRHGSYLFCHAGVDDRIVHRILDEGFEQINLEFNDKLRQGKIFEIYYSELGNVVRTKYRDKDNPLSELGVQSLKNQGIFALVNGHRSHVNGQQLVLRNKLLHIECDAELNANCRAKSHLAPGAAAVTIFNTYGTVNALSTNRFSLGVLQRNFEPGHQTWQESLLV
ncbi:metallophosphoesterase [Thiomicrorhabdus sp. 6S2-11]|uniref:Metallophosphoesterase n=1 Tax=Thiomicrorhabdus marina TaxID=2818442 RepID=A0ABS3Q6L3_9GAMM|nr:metallophosphoesterase [Thiomicrorhabdus marina]MBO1927947.1 metallophosphoesterase [Thiomicrorhabdus marina]